MLLGKKGKIKMWCWRFSLAWAHFERVRPQPKIVFDVRSSTLTPLCHHQGSEDHKYHDRLRSNMNHMIETVRETVYKIYKYCICFLFLLERQYFATKKRENATLYLLLQGELLQCHPLKWKALVIHGACKSCGTCSPVTGFGLWPFQVTFKLFYQSRPHWAESPCSLVKQKPDYVCDSSTEWGQISSMGEGNRWGRCNWVKKGYFRRCV